jgi:hypothetical protein
MDRDFIDCGTGWNGECFGRLGESAARGISIERGSNNPWEECAGRGVKNVPGTTRVIAWVDCSLQAYGGAKKDQMSGRAALLWSA